MRLVCPNCSAQYEIDASMIPDEGRDVQCSNCGHTWFELPAPPQMAEPDEKLAAEETPQEPVAEVSEPDEVAEIEEFDGPEPEYEAAPPVEDESVEVASEAFEEGPEAPSEFAEPAPEEISEQPTTRELEDEEEAVFGAPKPKQRPAASNEALDILRQEASEEIEKRRAPPSIPIETQTDMGPDVLSQRTPSRALRARMAQLEEQEEREKPEKMGGRWRNRFGKGKTVEETAAEGNEFAEEKKEDDGYQEPRRDLLPDIEEINSTLASTKTRDEPAPEVIAEQQRSFRQGFVIPVAAAAILIVAYAYAPAIAQRVPATEGALLQYVEAANGARDKIDSLLGR